MSICEELVNMYEYTKKIHWREEKNHEDNLFHFFSAGGGGVQVAKLLGWCLRARWLHCSVQERLQSFDNDSHVGPEIGFVLYT